MTRRRQTPPRSFKVRGQDIHGIEVTRVGDRVTLMCGPTKWPFRQERTFDRAELVRLDGGNTEDSVQEGARA